MCWLGQPLIITLVLDEERMAATQFIHATGNSMCSIIFRRKGQAIESNAFEISTLKSNQACRLTDRSLAEACTKQKLSWII
jgi:hypothetical protein